MMYRLSLSFSLDDVAIVANEARMQSLPMKQKLMANFQMEFQALKSSILKCIRSHASAMRELNNEIVEFPFFAGQVLRYGKWKIVRAPADAVHVVHLMRTKWIWQRQRCSNAKSIDSTSWTNKYEIISLENGSINHGTVAQMNFSIQRKPVGIPHIRVGDENRTLQFVLLLADVCLCVMCMW